MAARITIQDIADALGVSRNTVSKAINNTGVLADATRERILKKAIEMGYKQFSYANIDDFLKSGINESVPRDKGDIALLTTAFLGNSHFASIMLDKFQKEISQLGYSLTMYRVLSDEIQSRQLPASFDQERIAGIICIEMFDYEYSKMLCDLEMPILFVDTPVIEPNEPLKADCLYMNNQAYMYPFIKEMVRRNKTRIGFIGEYQHCQSFFERYMGYHNALFLLGLPCPDEYCLIDIMKGDASSTGKKYTDYLKESILKMTELPDVFICANDFIAIDALHVFKELGISVPEDVYLCGFDDSPESKLITPSLTTIHIHTQIMGFSAAHLLLSRIKEPALNFRTIYTETDLIYRESTED